MKHFAVIQHTHAEFLGLVESQLEKRDIGFHYFRPFVDQPLPAGATQFDALFLLGGKHPPTDRAACPWLDDELRLIKAFAQAHRPIVGFGFGALLIAAQSGAQLSAEPFHQAYWTRAHKTAAGKDDMLAQAVDGREVLVLCNGSARLPPAVEPVLVDAKGNWLAIHPTSESYAMLFRPELKPGMIEDMIMEVGRETPENIAELLAQARAQWGAMQALTDRVIVALVKELELMRERHKPPVFRLQVSE